MGILHPVGLQTKLQDKQSLKEIQVTYNTHNPYFKHCKFFCIYYFL